VFDEEGSANVLKRAENVRLTFNRGVFSRKGWLHISLGRKQYRIAKVHQDAVAESNAQQLIFPVRCARIGDRTYYKFQDRFYWDNDDLAPQQVHALLVTRQQREAARIDRAQAMVAIGEQRLPAQRRAIPDDVKQFVWMRDEGRCGHCGSGVELQYDHVIPVAMGGNSEAENLQILCGPCNRRKGPGLTLR
jgi:5-methylcytosine-specific restriction endonuclease McrA